MFGFPQVTRKKGFRFERNLIKSATLQLKFPSNPTVLVIGDEIKRSLGGQFPIQKPIMSGFARLKFEQGKTPIMDSSESSEEGYEFRTKDNKKIVHFTKDTFTYTIFGEIYTNFENTFEEIERIFLPLLKKAGINNLSRIAIRKINLMEAKSPDNVSGEFLLNECFKNSLVNNFTSFPELKYLESGTSSVQLKMENYQMNLSYGFLPDKPDLKRKKQILLDIDLFKISTDLLLNDVESEWKKINQEIFNVFNWALNKNLISSLK